MSGAGNNEDRMKETQEINKYLSALGDIIDALDKKGDVKNNKHRNSKVIHL